MLKARYSKLNRSQAFRYTSIIPLPGAQGPRGLARQRWLRDSSCRKRCGECKHFVHSFIGLVSKIVSFRALAKAWYIRLAGRNCLGCPKWLQHEETYLSDVKISMTHMSRVRWLHDMRDLDRHAAEQGVTFWVSSDQTSYGPQW